MFHTLKKKKPHKITTKPLLKLIIFWGYISENGHRMSNTLSEFIK